MNIQQIKTAISIKAAITLESMTLTQQLAEDNVTLQDWAQYWDNDARVRVVMHMDVFNQIKASKTATGYAFDGLAYKYKVVPAKPATATTSAIASYRRFVIITPQNIIAVF